MELLFESRQDQCLQRGDDEERVCDERNGDVRRRPGFVRVREAMRIDPERRQQRTDRGDRQDDCGDARQRAEQSRRPSNERAQPRHQ